MDSPRRIPSQAPQLLLSPCSSGRRSSDSNSPEFEFWMVRNPSFPEPDLLSADELFVDGVLLPLHLLHLHTHHRPDPRDSKPDPKPPNSYPDAEPRASPKTITAESYNPSTASKRWRDIFKKGDKKTSTRKNQEDKDKEKDKEKKREKKSQGGASSAELNINIWPFSRSRSAGNSGARPRIFPGTRKVSSAPCSRSNSAGESKSRKWLSSPGRGTGVHLGRSSPVWQVRRGGGVTEAKSGYSEAVNRSGKKMTSKTRKEDGKVVNLNVPMCNGCTEPLNCRSSSSKSNVAGGGTGNLFSIRSLFTKKVY